MKSGEDLSYKTTNSQPLSLTLTYKTWRLTRRKLCSEPFLGKKIIQPVKIVLTMAQRNRFIQRNILSSMRGSLILRCSYRTIKELLELVLLTEDIGGRIYDREAIKCYLHEKPHSVNDDGDDNYNDHHLVLTRRVGARSLIVDDDSRRTEMQIT